MSGAITHNVPMAEYIAHPGVSAGVLKTTLQECPAKAWHESAFNPDREPDKPKDETDVGEVAHEIFLLGTESCVEVIDPQDYPAKTTGGIPTGWTNQAIRGARDAARLAKKIPILKHDMQPIRDMVKSAHRFVDSLKESEPAVWGAFQDGTSEATLLWNQDGVSCKIRPDRISSDHAVTIHIKTTTKSAAPDAFAKTILNEYYIHPAFYRLGIKRVCNVDSTQLFLVIEQNPPYLCSLIGLSPEFVEFSWAQMMNGLVRWADCVTNGKFYGYPSRACYVDLPGWKAAQWEQEQVENFG